MYVDLNVRKGNIYHFFLKLIVLAELKNSVA